MKKVWFWDLETLDIFTATFIDRDSDEVRTFVITKDEDEREALFNFLDIEVAGLIGYNSIYFDAQVIEFIYRNLNCTVEEIREYASKIIETKDRRPDVPEWKLRHKHLDLFKALSLSVKAKRTGLKWCEFMMDLDNIEDLPVQKDKYNWKEKVLSYNFNDVFSTKKLYEKNKHEIELRKELTKRENINLMNSTEPDMAKKIFGKYLSEAMNIPLRELKHMQTDRLIVRIKDIIFPYINFKTDKLQQVLEEFNKIILLEEGKFEFEIDITGIKLKYGLGGLHGSVDKKVILSNDKYIIKSADVKSYYPNIAIRNKLHPAHIPQETFCRLYEDIYNERVSIPKSDPRNYILKILLNSTYGLSNDKFSFLRDRQFTLAICINGQLALSMLFEKILLEIPDSKLIMINTDGFEVLMPRKYEDKYLELCKEWEEYTKFELEFIDYDKMIVADVNNYISIFSDGKIKCKGSFEFKNIPLHKNKSHNIIPLAIYNYFVEGISVEDTIHNHKNIFDFCAGVKASSSPAKGKSHFELHWINKDTISKEELSKTVRYFISKKGKYLFKKYEDGSIAHVEAPLQINMVKKDWKVTYFNKAYYPKDFSEYNIDYIYYIVKAKDIIQKIEGNINQQVVIF